MAVLSLYDISDSKSRRRCRVSWLRNHHRHSSLTCIGDTEHVFANLAMQNKCYQKPKRKDISKVYRNTRWTKNVYSWWHRWKTTASKRLKKMSSSCNVTATTFKFSEKSGCSFCHLFTFSNILLSTNIQKNSLHFFNRRSIKADN